jgi:CO dehydrogenase/acetyl-CoA synthase delta subunit
VAELKFIKPGVHEREPACCGQEQNAQQFQDVASCKTRSQDREEVLPAWVTGTFMTAAGIIPVISTDLTISDYWEHVKCRIGAFRNNYTVNPGLYAVGSPGRNSDVLASANYKLSFDALRKALKGLNVWVIVLDTKGINVWCAAGKGTFATEELMRRITLTGLEKIVDHKKIIVPQLGAPGISAHKVKKVSGFTVCFGPVRADDIGAFITAGYMATGEMRTVTFSFIDRLVLTPMEINPAMKKYYPMYALIMLLFFGFQPGGILFRDAFIGGLPFLLFGLVSVLAGAMLTPLLLPFIPFRSFAVKGWITGLIAAFLCVKCIPAAGRLSAALLFFTYLFFPLASSYIALQFTGSTTFTGMSGVKKELKVSIPIYISGAVASAVLLIIYKLGEWRVI